MKLVRKQNSRFPEFPAFFDDFFGRDLFESTASNWTRGTLPAVNIREEGEQFYIELAAPGLQKEDFKIELENDVLIISVKKEEQTEQQDTSRYSRREFRYTTFSRSFTLPKDKVEADQIKANYADGILHIAIPKSEEVKVKPGRLIEIS